MTKKDETKTKRQKIVQLLIASSENSRKSLCFPLIILPVSSWFVGSKPFNESESESKESAYLKSWSILDLAEREEMTTKGCLRRIWAHITAFIQSATHHQQDEMSETGKTDLLRFWRVSRVKTRPRSGKLASTSLPGL